MDSAFSLSWDAHKQKICNGFSSLQQNEEFVDMTLAAEGHCVKVHQNVIAVASPYLKNLLKSIPCQHPVIFLNNISHATLISILEYIYKGEAKLPIEQVSVFFNTAKALQLLGIDFNDSVSNLEEVIKDNNSQEEDQFLIKRFTDTQEATYSYENNDFEDCNNADNRELSITQFSYPPTLPESGLNIDNMQNVENLSLDLNEQQPEPLNLNIITLEPTSEPNITTSPLVDYETKISAANIMVSKDHDYEMIDCFVVKEVDKDIPISLVQSKDVLNTEDQLSIPMPSGSSENIVPGNVWTTDAGSGKIIPHEKSDLLTMKTQTAAPSNLKSPRRKRKLTNRGKEIKRLLIRKIKDTEIMDTQSLRPYKTIPSLDESGNEVIMPEFDVTSNNPKYTLSNKGCLQLIIDRYLYYAHHVSGRGLKRRWRCTEYRKLRCPAYLDAFKDVITSRINNHNHQHHDKKIIDKRKRNIVFDNLEDAINGAAQICEDTREELTLDDE